MTGEDQRGKIKEQLKQRMTMEARGLERSRAQSLVWVHIDVHTHFAVFSLRFQYVNLQYCTHTVFFNGWLMQNQWGHLIISCVKKRLVFCNEHRGTQKVVAVIIKMNIRGKTRTFHHTNISEHVMHPE